MSTDDLGGYTGFDVIRVKNGNREVIAQSVATEVPCTIVVNGCEIATLMCTPTYLREFAVGYLFTSGMINEAGEVKKFYCDSTKWRIDVETTSPIDTALLDKRIYTSGCGKGVMYSSVIMLSSRYPIDSMFSVTAECVSHCARWLLTCSSLYRETHGVHTAAISANGEIPSCPIDDIGRHNAADKVIGHALMNGYDFSSSLLVCTGRISSEILHKVKRCGIPLVLSRGVPTHQTVLMARDMGITVVGFARGGSLTIYSHPDRVTM